MAEPVSDAGERAQQFEGQSTQHQAGWLGTAEGAKARSEGTGFRREDAADAARRELLDRAAAVVGRVEVARRVERQAEGPFSPVEAKTLPTPSGVNFSIVLLVAELAT